MNAIDLGLNLKILKIQIYILPKKLIIISQQQMGNNIIPSQNTAQQKPEKVEKQKQQQYIYISQRKDNIVGKPRIVKSNTTNIQLQQYVVSNPQSPIQIDINLYKLRSSSLSKNLAVVFHHKVLDQHDKIFMVRIQKMKGRLNQIQGLSCTEGLCLLQASLNGFAQLVYHAKMPFVITQKMIAINQSPQVRVWCNQNFALNKIMPGIKIRNQNIMIHQVFSAISEHVAIDQRQAFNDIRFKIAQCQRIMQSKMIISYLLQNCNRKAVIQELVDKQIMRATRLNGNNGQVNNFNGAGMQPNMNSNAPGNMSNTMAHGNYGNMNQNPIPNPNYKIPMNYGYPGQGSVMMNPQPVPMNINSMQNSNLSPLSPINPNATIAEPPVQRIHLAPEQYIKDDEGSDRIRMIRQEHMNPQAFTNTNGVTQSFPPAYMKPTGYGSEMTYDVSQLPIIMGNRRMSNDQLQMGNKSTNNQNGKISSATHLPSPHNAQAQHQVFRKAQQKSMTPVVSSNIEETGNTERRNRSIFGKNKTQENIDTNNMVSPRTVSPLRNKLTNNQIPSDKANSTNLTSKIALSENKLSQMQKKINKLKQQFSRNSQRQKEKHSAPYSDIMIKDRTDRIRLAVTPPHSSNTNRMNLNQQMRPVTKYEKNQRMKSQGISIGQTAAKWDKKLSQILNKQGKSQDNSEIAIDRQQLRNIRKSDIIIDDPNKPVMRKSMITQINGNKRVQFGMQPPSPNSFGTHINFKSQGLMDNISNKRDLSPTFKHMDGNNIIIKQTTPTITGVYGGTMNKFPQMRPQQHKTTVNFNGNAFVSTMPSGAFGNLLENRSTIIPKKNHF